MLTGICVARQQLFELEEMLGRIDGDETIASIEGVLQLETLLVDGDLLRERHLLDQDGL